MTIAIGSQDSGRWAALLVAVSSICIVGLRPANAAATPITLEASTATYKAIVKPFLTKHCVQCHGETKPKAKLALLKLDANMESSVSGARWAMVYDQLQSGDMPPEEIDQRDRPDEATTEQVMAWIKAELKRTGKHLAKREMTVKGNSVPHELLFGKPNGAPFSSPARLRRLSPEIYEAFTRDIGKGVNGLGQPFSPAANSNFGDSGTPEIDEPITSLLIRNALAIVKKYTSFKIEKGEFKRIGSMPKQFQQLLDPKNEITDEHIAAAVQHQFDRVLKRKASDDEVTRLTALMKQNIKDAGRTMGIRYTLAAVLLMPEAVFRWEVGEATAPGERKRLTPREIAFALNFALGDRQPEGWLLDDAKKGKLDTKECVAEAVRRLLSNPKRKPERILRFFREYFGYHKAIDVFKDPKDNPQHDARIYVSDTDRLIEYILEKDQNVLRELLTTNKSFIAVAKSEETIKKRADGIKKFNQEKKKNPKKYESKVYKPWGKNLNEAYNYPDFIAPEKQPVELPKSQRAGILTQPSWLIANSVTDDNHAIHRGIWIRERLLGGVVPDIPITVDAQLPIEPDQPLRHRMRVTHVEYCWQCHQLINHLAYPLEMYDHYGRYREKELVLDPQATEKNVDKKGKPLGPIMRGVAVNTKGAVEHVGDKALDGPVENAIDLLHRLAKSERVEQVFVRHAFRYWMGRNETLGDAPSLQGAHNAYRDSGGSMNALVTAILTSDSFLYRVTIAADSTKIE